MFSGGHLGHLPLLCLFLFLDSDALNRLTWRWRAHNVKLCVLLCILGNDG